jgi:hypothetical protein
VKRMQTGRWSSSSVPTRDLRFVGGPSTSSRSAASLMLQSHSSSYTSAKLMQDRWSLKTSSSQKRCRNAGYLPEWPVMN